MLYEDTKAICGLLSMEFYRFKRYKVPACLILVEVEDSLFHEVLAGKIRPTDQYKKIEDNFYAIVYSHAELDDARNAFFNIFIELDERSEISRVAIAQIRESDEGECSVVQRAYEELTHKEH